MYTSHFYKRMGERVHNNKKRLNHKEEKKQNNNSKIVVNKALKNPIGEYVDVYGVKYIYALIDQICYKFIYRHKKMITVYKVDFEKEKNKYNIRDISGGSYV